MFGYIYKTVNKINGKIYVGKKKSNTFDRDYFGSGKLIKRAIEKYGIKNFSVELIDTAENLDELNEKEIYYIDILKSQNLSIGYNIARGGDGGDLTATMTKEEYNNFVKKCRDNSLGKNNPNYGNGDKIRGSKNPAKRPEVRRKISKAVSGKGNGMYGKKHNPESMQRKLENHLKNHGFYVNKYTKDSNNWRVLILSSDKRYIFRSKSSMHKHSYKTFGISQKVSMYAYEITKHQGFYKLKNGINDADLCWIPSKYKKFLKDFPDSTLYNYNYLKKENPELICNCKEMQIM